MKLPIPTCSAGFLLLVCLQGIVHSARITNYDILNERGDSGSCSSTEYITACHVTTEEPITIDVSGSIPHGAICVTADIKSCYMCLAGRLEEVDCGSGESQTRKKRGFFKKAFKSLKKASGIGIFRRFFGRRNRNTAPRITCPFIGQNTYAPEKSTTAIVSWASPRVSDSENNIARTVQIAGKPSGSHFAAGRHTVKYRTTDSGGLSATCAVSFTVIVIRCPLPPNPSNGQVNCENNVAGSKCSFRCNQGYRLSGPADIFCHRMGKMMPAPPTCQKVNCGSLALPTHGILESCTDGKLYGSLCALSCPAGRGYTAARQASASCSHEGKWILNAWKCQDTQAPVFTSCPETNVHTLDTSYTWPAVIAKDNSGKVKVKQTTGRPSGSPLSYGAHINVFEATDDAGNKAQCIFTVKIKKAVCPRPSSNDTDMRFTCNGLEVGSVCRLSCNSGSFIEGSKYLSCVQSEFNGTVTSEWEPVEGGYPRCFKKSCPSLNTPKNGALVCDKELGGTVCQMQCDSNYDVMLGNGHLVTYVCGTDTNWKPSNQVPDCTELSYPDEYLLPTEFYYFWGDCDNSATMADIKSNFLANLNEIGISACFHDTCSVDDVQVSCGEEGDPDDLGFFRRRRDVIEATRERRATKPRKRLRIRITLRVANTNRTISPEAAMKMMQAFVQNSSTVLASSTFLRSMYMKGLPTTPRPTLPPRAIRPLSNGESSVYIKRIGGWNHRIRPNHATSATIAPTMAATTMIPMLQGKAVTGHLNMRCSPGHVQIKQNSGVCVPCPMGTYADRSSKSCLPCPKMTYQDQKGSEMCKRCPRQQVTLVTGGTSISRCLELCAPNTFSTTGTRPCYPCPDGTFQALTGGKTCETCPKSSATGRGSKCKVTNGTVNFTSDPEKVRVSEFLLTCGSEHCLTF